MSLENSAWSLIEFRVHDGISEVLNGTKVTAIFSADRVAGSGGCNAYGAATTFDSGTEGSIQISNLGATRMNCLDPPGIGAQESRYFEFLLGSNTFRIDGNTLTLSEANTREEKTLVFESTELERK